MRARVAASLTLALLIVMAVGLAGHPAPARADGDPGSDVLVNQNLFFGGDAGISIAQQQQLGALLQAAARSRVPVRVALIASRADLGAITALWQKPRAYASFLGTELSLAYRGRLLVVMPGGFGFNWPGHSSAAEYATLRRVHIGAGGPGLATAAGTAVRVLAAADGVKLGASTQPSVAAPSAAQPDASAPTPTAGSRTDSLVAIIVVALAASLGLLFLARRPARRWIRRLRPPGRTATVAGTITLLAGATIATLVAIGPPRPPQQADALATNPNLDPGSGLSRPAPGFTLTDEFGRRVSLHAFRGKVVLLAFNDSECTTICPLTTTAMLEAKAMLGNAGADVQLLGIDANPKATSLEDVYSYSQLHGMLGAWHFLTGSLSALKRVWGAYAVQAAVQGGEIAHTPALFVIDREGRERKLYMTQQSYAAVGQLAQLLAHEASSLLPKHPTVHSSLSYSHIAGVSPTTRTQLPRSSGGSVPLGPGRPRLYLFFATWSRQVTGLAGGMEGLNRYSALARQLGLPPLEAIDEGSVEPPGALRSFLSGLGTPLAYPVGLDRDGRVADGYEVQGLPWLMVVSGSGKIAWYYSVTALGWPTAVTLATRVRQALARSPGRPASLAAAQSQLAGSPPALAALHAQASRLLGDQPALLSRIRTLRHHPIVINVWASWCAPCRSEFGLLASAAARYGRRVAFLGADTNDSPGDALSFLEQHPVAYPSYQTTTGNLTALIPQGIQGLPTTIYINQAGKLAYAHIGQYDSQGTLDADIETYALGG